jgi:hypothetical protein
MEYLVEVRWSDPIADALQRILVDDVEGVEQTTSYLPLGGSRAFVVYRCDRSEVLQGLVDAVSKLGARVRITPVAQNLMPMAA